jgi:hypothetical protein
MRAMTDISADLDRSYDIIVTGGLGGHIIYKWKQALLARQGYYITTLPYLYQVLYLVVYIASSAYTYTSSTT